MTIPSGWTKEILGNLLLSKNDKTKQVKSTEYLSSGAYPVVDQSAAFICGFHDDQTKLIAEDLPLTVFGDHTRHTKFISFPFIAGADGTQLLKPRGKLNDKLFYYLVYFAAEKIGNYGYDRHFKHLKEFQCAIPVLASEQSKIAEVLSTVDRAIAQTDALIAKQQRIKTGLMQDLLTRGIDEHSQLRSEATHAFKDSPLGRIPVEWEVARLDDVADVNRGKFTHRPRDDARFYGGLYPFIQTGNVTANVGRTVDEFSQTLSVMGTRVSKEFPKGTIAITIAANIADTAILGRPMYFPDSVVGAVVRTPNSVRFIEMIVRSQKSALEQLAPKSAQSNINLETLRPLVIVLPKPDEQARIASTYDADDDRQISNERSLHKLRHLKTALMQDLLTGKVRVTPLLEPAGEATT